MDMEWLILSDIQCCIVPFGVVELSSVCVSSNLCRSSQWLDAIYLVNPIAHCIQVKPKWWRCSVNCNKSSRDKLRHWSLDFQLKLVRPLTIYRTVRFKTYNTSVTIPGTCWRKQSILGFSLSQFVQGTHRRKSTSRWISQLKLPYVSPTDHNLPNRFKKTSSYLFRYCTPIPGNTSRVPCRLVRG